MRWFVHLLFVFLLTQNAATLRLLKPRMQVPLMLTTEGWYALEASVGTASAKLAVDTGSSLLWIRPSGPPDDIHLATANSSDSQTALSMEEQQGRFSAQYGRGTVSGKVGSEQVRFGNDQSRRVCKVGYVDTESPFWLKQQTIDGVIGLACGQGAPTGALRCLLPSATRPQISEYLEDKERIFTLELGANGGMLSVGFIPPEYQGSLVFMPPSEDCGHWSVPLLSLSLDEGVGGSTPHNRLDSGGEAIIDSGTDSIVGPTFTVIALAQALGAEPGPAIEGYGGQVSFFTVPCASRLTLPNMTLSLGSPGPDTQAFVTLGAEDLIGPPSASSSASLASSGIEERCRLRIVGWETQSWILGKIFLRRLRGTVFDLDRRRVALAL